MSYYINITWSNYTSTIDSLNIVYKKRGGKNNENTLPIYFVTERT